MIRDVDNLEEVPRLPFAVQFPSAVFRLAWTGGMLVLGAWLTRFDFAGMVLLPLLALLAGVSSNWSG